MTAEPDDLHGCAPTMVGLVGVGWCLFVADTLRAYRPPGSGLFHPITLGVHLAFAAALAASMVLRRPRLPSQRMGFYMRAFVVYVFLAPTAVMVVGRATG
jgi:hypothetical protein